MTESSPNGVGPDEAIKLAWTSLVDLIRGHQPVFLVYSIGALFVLRLIKELEAQAILPIFIFVGVGMELSPNQLSSYSKYFTKGFYERSRLDKRMLRDHGPGWFSVVASVASWMQPGSSLLPCGLRSMHGLRNSVLFIVGDQDDVMGEDIRAAHRQSVLPEPVTAAIVEGNHYEYFTKCWPEVSAIIGAWVDKQKLASNL